jgi:hypothetical protein
MPATLKNRVAGTVGKHCSRRLFEAVQHGNGGHQTDAVQHGPVCSQDKSDGQDADHAKRDGE